MRPGPPEGLRGASGKLKPASPPLPAAWTKGGRQFVMGVLVRPKPTTLGATRLKGFVPAEGPRVRGARAGPDRGSGSVRAGPLPPARTPGRVRVLTANRPGRTVQGRQ